MERLITSIVFFHLLLYIYGGNGRKVPENTDSPVGCSSEGKECAYNSTNLIDMIIQVPTLEECRQLCLDHEQCEFITYMDEDAVPLARACFLFKSCETVKDCDPIHCSSQNMDCYRTCGSDFVGHLDENLIDALPNVENELDCKKQCSSTNNCTWYTYYPQNDTLYHQFCFLQSELLQPIQSCGGQCVSGPSDCSANKCLLGINGNTSESVMLTDTSGTHNISVVGGTCTLRFLAVGGGGEGYCGGGGSGYVQYQSVQVTSGTEISAEVGNLGEPSTVVINGKSTVANKGQDGQGSPSYVGGDGYSGGGDGRSNSKEALMVEMVEVPLEAPEQGRTSPPTIYPHGN